MSGTKPARRTVLDGTGRRWIEAASLGPVNLFARGGVGLGWGRWGVGDGGGGGLGMGEVGGWGGGGGGGGRGVGRGQCERGG